MPAGDLGDLRHQRGHLGLRGAGHGQRLGDQRVQIGPAEPEALVGGQPLDPETPTPAYWRDRIGEHAPQTMGDGVTVSFRRFDDGFSPDSRLDQAIIATRRAVFPELGLDPGF